MSRLVGSAAVLVAVAVLAAPAPAADAPRLSVTVDRTTIATQLGRKVVFNSTITNEGAAAASGLVAHLNVLSLHPGTYVDPEDWSSQRTRYLDPLGPGESATVTWHIHAVNDGRIGMYVAALPQDAAGVAPATGPTVELVVKERKTLNSGGILPLALGIPLGLGLLALGVRLRRGRA